MPKSLPLWQELHAEEFVAVDFETANRDPASACQIALVKMRAGEVCERLVSYLRPAVEGWEFSFLHGIDEATVADAPRWPELSARIQEFVGQRPVWAHNASFDARVWRALDAHYHVHSAPANVLCTLHLGRLAVPDLPNHRLPTVTKHYRPSFALNHHDAASDAEACGYIVAGFQADESVKTLLL